MSTNPNKYKVRINMFRALPEEIMWMIWRQYYTSVVMTQLVAKTRVSHSIEFDDGPDYTPIQCPSTIRFRWRVSKGKLSMQMSRRELQLERANARKAQDIRRLAQTRRDFEDWFHLTGSSQRMSKRKKVHFSAPDALGHL
jgi:hypothetical protein